MLYASFLADRLWSNVNFIFGYMYNTQSVAMETNYYIVACTLVHALLNVILYFTGGKTSNKNFKFEFNMLQIMHSI